MESKVKTVLLTVRELEVLKLVASGKSNCEIAEKLVITQYTVKAHISSILKKLKVKNRLEAALSAYKNGIVK